MIAGRKRLVAAIDAGIADVPCLIYDVDDAEAAALAQADNLRACGTSEFIPIGGRGSVIHSTFCRPHAN